jgi:HSP20 family protein
MSNLTRWDPFREMMSFRSAIDRLFDETVFNRQPDFEGQISWSPALDVAETGDEYLVKASLPGIEPDDLEITYSNNVLTIKGEMQSEREVEDQRYHLRERRSGSFSRSLSLPSIVDADHIQTSYTAGVLTLHLPKVEEAKPRRIQVRSAESPRMIEGQSRDIKNKN